MTRRQWRAGGYLCPRCGCETNMAGQKVTADTPPASFLTLQWALLGASLAVLLLVGVGLAASLIVVGERAPVAAVAAPPVVPVIAPAPATRPVEAVGILENVPADGKITLLVGRATVLKSRVPYSRVAFSQPDVALSH